jgi:hypothetical protein
MLAIFQSVLLPQAALADEDKPESSSLDKPALLRLDQENADDLPPDDPDPSQEELEIDLSLNESGWTFSFAPYLWTTAVRAHADDPLPSTATVDFVDLLERLDVGAMANFEAQHGQWGLFVQGLYVQIADDEWVDLGFLPRKTVKFKARFTQSHIGFGGFYRIGGKDRSVDLLLGARYTHFSTNISFGRFIDRHNNIDMVDPIIGARLNMQLSDRWSMVLRGDIAPFETGADKMWGGSLILSYRINDFTSVGIGYRYYRLEFEEAGIDLDLAYYGPMVGMAFHF